MNKDTQDTSKLRSRITSLLLAPIFAALIIWQWPIISSKILHTKQSVETFIADIDALGEKSRALMTEVEATKQTTTDRLNQLEAHLAESQKLHAAIEASSYDTDDDLLEEVEQWILYADQHLSITPDFSVALESLHKAEARLAQVDNAQLSALHDSIVNNIKSIETIADASAITVGTSHQLKNMAAIIETLPLRMNADLMEVEMDLIPIQASTAEKLWFKFFKEIWEDVKEFIHVQKASDPGTQILSPSQIYFIHENLKLKFMLLQFSLLSQDKASFNNDFEATVNWIDQHYDKNSASVVDMLQNLKQLHEDNTGLKKPDISASLDAIHNFRNMRNEENK